MPVASPVVEVLVGNDSLHALVVRVCRSARLGKNVGCVENIEALVLHSTCTVCTYIDICYKGASVVYLRVDVC